MNYYDIRKIMLIRTLDFTSVNESKLKELEKKFDSIHNALDSINF